MLNRILSIIVILFLFLSVYVTVSLSKDPQTIASYASVLGVHVTTKPMPTLGPMNIIGSTVKPVNLEFPSPTPVLLEKDSLWGVVQKWRVDNGLSPYQESARMCEIANQRLSEIQQNWSHEGFTWQRFCPAEGRCILSENLARKYSTESDVLEGWLSSSSHAENLRKPYILSCIATDGDYVVHIMGDL